MITYLYFFRKFCLQSSYYNRLIENFSLSSFFLLPSYVIFRAVLTSVRSWLFRKIPFGKSCSSFYFSANHICFRPFLLSDSESRRSTMSTISTVEIPAAHATHITEKVTRKRPSRAQPPPIIAAIILFACFTIVRCGYPFPTIVI